MKAISLSAFLVGVFVGLIFIAIHNHQEKQERADWQAFKVLHKCHVSVYGADYDYWDCDDNATHAKKSGW